MSVSPPALSDNPSLCVCVRQREYLKITLSCLFGGSTGDGEVWVHPLQLCVHTPLIFCPLSIHLRPSSLQSICHPRLPSLMTVLALFHHFCLSGMSFFIFSWVYMVSRALSSSFIPALSLLIDSHPLLSFTSSSSSSPIPLTVLTIIRQNLLKLQTCRGKKNKMGRALIPGIWDSPFRPGQNEPRSVWFGQCYSCLSKWPQVPCRFEEKSTQTRAGTELNLTTIFESFFPSKSFWLKHTHMHPVCLH